VAGMSEVYADLVGATCQQPDFEQAEVRDFSAPDRVMAPVSRTATRRSPFASTWPVERLRSSRGPPPPPDYGG
jgi:hypothetical protein